MHGIVKKALSNGILAFIQGYRELRHIFYSFKQLQSVTAIWDSKDPGRQPTGSQLVPQILTQKNWVVKP